MYTAQEIHELTRTYRDGLLADVVPFWLRHALDREHRGYFTALDRDGTVIDTDKAVWFQGRFAWLLSTLYHHVEPRPEWLDAARSGIDFLRRHCFDTDGRMFFLVTRDGQQLRKRRYAFSECFAVMALATFARAAGDERDGDEARDLFRRTVLVMTSPGALEPKVNPVTRPQKGFGAPMILLGVAQELREYLGDDSLTQWVDRSIDEIRRDFVKPELRAVMETVGASGEFLDHYDGRLLNPGHAIEGAWFILREAEYRGGDPDLVHLGTTMLDWMWERGWDREHGGLLYFTDVKGLPVQEYWHDMKFWWPHCEAIIATLYAYHLTGDAKYADWHRMVHDWAHRHFPDPEFGEWYGYLHRDGTISSPAKGTLWKGPFHIPRMQFVCWRLAEAIHADSRSLS